MLENVKIQQNNKADEVITAITERCKNESSLFTVEEIFAEVQKNGLSRHFFENYITQTHKMTMRKYFDEIGVLKSTKNEFFATLTLLKNKYEASAKPKNVTALKNENQNINFGIIASNAKKFTGLTVRELLIKENIISINSTDVSDGVLYSVGEEPADIKKRLDALFEKLDLTYPDKVISGLHKDHKKWGETVTSLYRKLGYANGNDFLRAYGYTVNENKGGRTANNSAEIIKELKNRYGNRAVFSSVAKLKEANPDLAPKIKSLENSAPQIFGSSLKEYLIKENILSATVQKTANEVNEITTPVVSEKTAQITEENTEPKENPVAHDAVTPLTDSTETKEIKKDTESASREVKSDEKAKEEAELKAQEEAKRLAIIKLCADRRAKKVCQYCGGTFKGLFKKTCSKCGKKKNY